MRTEWFVEQDPYCQRVLATHWPFVPIYYDIRDVHADHACPHGGCPDCLAPVEVLCGGFPCQDLSLAGKGAGIDGARSGLWAEYARLIGELEPRWVVVENVPALKSRGLGRVLADLAACGYDAEWDCIPASAVGACHQRDRIWLVAYPNGESVRVEPERDQRQGRQVRAALGGDTVAVHDGADGQLAGAVPDANRLGLQGAVTGPQAPGLAEPRGDDHVADAEVVALGAGLRPDEPAEERWGRSGHGGSPDGWWSAEPDVGRVADGVPDRVDRLRSLGNALVPQVAEWVAHQIVAWEEAQG